MRIGPLILHQRRLTLDRCVECGGILWRRPRYFANGTPSPHHHRCLEALIARKWPALACFICGRKVA